MEEKRKTWGLTAKAVIREQLVFSEEVTAEEARRLYAAGDCDDIYDPEVKELIEVLKVT